MNVLVVDVGGTHVKGLVSGQKESRKFDSGPALVPGSMVMGVQKTAGDWKYDVVSIGYPGPVLHNRPVANPHNLGRGCSSFGRRSGAGGRRSRRWERKTTRDFACGLPGG